MVSRSSVDGSLQTSASFSRLNVVDALGAGMLHTWTATPAPGARSEGKVTLQAPSPAAAVLDPL
eukprot:8164133-Pyramimonas_sp.AAC.1